MTATDAATDPPTKPRPDGLDSPWVPKVIKAMSAANTWIFRKTGGRIGSRFLRGAPVLLLTTVGRKTGQKRTAPVLYLEDGDRVIVVASKGGLPSNPLWYLNLVANPEVEIQMGKEVRPMRAATAAPEEKAALWPKLLSMYKDFADYQSWTDRDIPVVILSPA